MKCSKAKIIFKYIIPLAITILVISFLIGVQFWFPSKIILLNNDTAEYKLELPSFLTAKAVLADDITAVTTRMPISVNGENGTTYIKPSNEGEAKVTLRLFGLLSVKDVVVKVIPNTKLYAGGEAIGISIKSEGLVIVDFTDVKGLKNNNKSNPALEAGLKKGDMILKCNGTIVTDSDDFADLVREGEGKPLYLSCIRDGVNFSSKVMPVLTDDDNIYRVGMWVRDGTDGIGTLTFIDKTTGAYGAIGHGINDSDLNMLYSVGSGCALQAKIIGIEAGKSGDPGELKGIFTNADEPLGDVRLNCNTGVYGKYFLDIEENKEYIADKKEYEIGMSYEIETGKASILTTLDDEGPKEYEIEIKKIYKNRISNPKSMVISVTDPELIKRTGGIVQGMSGSPIIQNGKIVGAVTHVLINDSTMGYGIFIESMINNLEYTNNNNKQN